MFGALIIGFGVGYLAYTKTGVMLTAVLIGAAVTFADYFLILLVRKIFPKSNS